MIDKLSAKLFKNRKTKISYGDVQKQSVAIGRRIADGIKAGEIPADFQLACISRGGSIPAVIISNMLNKRPVKYLEIRSYNGDNRQGEIIDETPADYIDAARPMIIIDDLYDTGATIRYIQQKYPGALIATLFYKTKNDGYKKLWHAGKKMPNVWLTFPWCPAI